jgi:hypothetical protein
MRQLSATCENICFVQRLMTSLHKLTQMAAKRQASWHLAGPTLKTLFEPSFATTNQ